MRDFQVVCEGVFDLTVKPTVKSPASHTGELRLTPAPAPGSCFLQIQTVAGEEKLPETLGSCRGESLASTWASSGATMGIVGTVGITGERHSGQVPSPSPLACQIKHFKADGKWNEPSPASFSNSCKVLIYFSRILWRVFKGVDFRNFFFFAPENRCLLSFVFQFCSKYLKTSCSF